MESSGPTLQKKKILTYLKALQKLVEPLSAEAKVLFDQDKPPVFLQINCIKVPKVSMHQMRIQLPHSMIGPNDDVALFVRDLKKGRRVDYENTIRHYEELLQSQGCSGSIKAVIPFNQVKTEYKQFEMRRKLVNLYDYFLVDGRIAGHMAHVLGKMFRQRRKLPTSLHMDKKNLREEIDKALRKTSLEVHASGDCSIVKVGTLAMGLEEIADNVIEVVKQLGDKYPGGWKNIRALRIKSDRSFAIPIYYTLKNKNEVEVPEQRPIRPKAYESVEGELSTFTSNLKAIVEPDGTVSLQREGPESDEESDAEDGNDSS